MEDPRVPLLREKLRLAGDAADLRYDAKLAEAVKKFQRANDLPATGMLDANTVRELNGPPRDRSIDIILANMERWRWYPRDLGKAHVAGQPAGIQAARDSQRRQVWKTRIVIGKPDKATPLLTATMKYITVNPTWNVPPSIVHNEYLPALQQDPTVLERMGLKVSDNRDGSVHIYQPPGDGNALGRVRFNFPNRFLVYQHDTPDKHLFAHDARAYSHGCMRVQDPPKYAEVLLNIARPSESWTADKIKRMFGTTSRTFSSRSRFRSIDLSDRLRRRRRQAATPPRRLRPRQPDDVGDQERARHDRVRCRSASASEEFGGIDESAARRRSRRAPSSFFESLFGGGSGHAARPGGRSRRAR